MKMKKFHKRINTVNPILKNYKKQIKKKNMKELNKKCSDNKF